jgi:hypothetical protein
MRPKEIGVSRGALEQLIHLLSRQSVHWLVELLLARAIKGEKRCGELTSILLGIDA